MSTFSIDNTIDNINFKYQLTLNPARTAKEQLMPQRVTHRELRGPGQPEKLQSIIGANSSLKIEFGWEFNNIDDFIKLVSTGVNSISPKYKIKTLPIVGNSSCSAIAFEPHNSFDRLNYEDLDIFELVSYNNSLINYQEKIVDYILESEIFQHHSLVLNDYHRFYYFREARHDAEMLESYFWKYIDALRTVTATDAMYTAFIEQAIGCHFLHNPTLFFELLTFLKLKGNLNE